MYVIDFSTLSSTINSFFRVVGGILRFDSTAIDTILSQESGSLFALAILLLGGISLAIGQSVVLFANRVSRRRFVFSLIVSGIVFLLWVLLWAGSTWILIQVFSNQIFSYAEVLLGAATSMAPLIFGFLVLLPYIGNIIFQVLRIWVLLIFLVLIGTGTNANYLQAMLFAASGWLLIEFVLRFPPLQFERLRAWGWRFATGTPQRLDIDEVAQQFIEEVHARYDLNHDEGNTK